ncbi:MAG: HI1506-related protein [Proteobacteria bacterium]|nr:HI1506-related protein [Pseudomonadota bacterium]
MIRITSKRDGFRRASIAHAALATDYKNDDFSEEQLALLQAEPMLIVEIIADTVEPTVEAEAEAAKSEPEANAEPSAKTQYRPVAAAGKKAAA